MKPKLKPKLVASELVAFAIVALAAVALALFMSGCAQQPSKPTVLDTLERGPNELLGSDVFAEGLVSTEISVLGVRLGMTEGRVKSILGPPDVSSEFDFGAIRNWGYGESLGLNDTGVNYHFRNGFVTRITVFPEMNSLLIEDRTSSGKSKELVYSIHGQPDRQLEIRTGMLFVYNDKGLEIYLGRQSEDSYAFVLPGRKLPTMATLELPGENLTAPRVPRLVTDTTSRCDEGPTAAFSPGTGECMAFDNACNIPSHWLEVLSCEPGNLTDSALAAAWRASVY